MFDKTNNGEFSFSNLPEDQAAVLKACDSICERAGKTVGTILANMGDRAAMVGCSGIVPCFTTQKPSTVEVFVMVATRERARELAEIANRWAVEAAQVAAKEIKAGTMSASIKGQATPWKGTEEPEAQGRN